MAEIVPPILTLNNDCLLKIFTYFDVVQLIELESVCRRFADVIQVEYKRRRDFVYADYEELYGVDFMTVEVFQKISERIGPNLQLLDLNWEYPMESLSQKFITMLQHSEKLEYLRFLRAFDIFLDSRSFDLLKKRSPNLKTIDGCGGSSRSVLNLNKNNNQFLREASNLETLRLRRADLRQCGKWYSWLPKLKEACFVFCRMEIRQMQNFIKHHKSLEVLELTGENFWMNFEKRLDAITTNLMSLNRLNLTLYFKSKSLPNLKTIANLPQLTDLTVIGFQPIKDLLEALAERNILERLLIGDNTRSTDELKLTEEMLKPLRKFRNLKSLTIESRHLEENFFSTLPLEHKIEYLGLDFTEVTIDGIFFLVQQGQSLKTICLSARVFSSIANREKDFAAKIEAFVRDRLHPLTLEFLEIYGYSIPEVNIPGLKICQSDRSYWPATKPLRP